MSVQYMLKKEAGTRRLLLLKKNGAHQCICRWRLCTRTRTDFADATDFIHWYMGEAIRINGVSPHDGYNLYLNYHEGTAGFSRKTYQSKPWLLVAAENVQRRSQRYGNQYKQCKESLQPGFFQRLMGW